MKTHIIPFTYPHPWLNKVGALTVLTDDNNYDLTYLIKKRDPLEEPGTLLKVGLIGPAGLNPFTEPCLAALVRLEQTRKEVIFLMTGIYHEWNERYALGHHRFLFWKPFKHKEA